MVQAGCIPCLVQAMTGGKLSQAAKGHCATVLAFLATDKANHEEIIRFEGVAPLVVLLKNGILAAKKHAAIALARRG